MAAPDPLPAMIRSLLPHWNPQWLDVAVPAVKIVVILAVAGLIRLLLRQLLKRLCTRYSVPAEMMIGIRRTGGFIISVSALLMVLHVIGVSAGTLWTAFTGFAAVGAVAFFAAWSVLSNIFCTFLIITTRPFRLHDHIELLEGGDKPGPQGPRHRHQCDLHHTGRNRRPRWQRPAGAQQPVLPAHHPAVARDQRVPFALNSGACQRSWLSLLPRRL